MSRRSVGLACRQFICSIPSLFFLIIIIIIIIIVVDNLLMIKLIYTDQYEIVH